MVLNFLLNAVLVVYNFDRDDSHGDLGYTTAIRGELPDTYKHHRFTQPTYPQAVVGGNESNEKQVSGGGGNGAIGIHDDFGTADDHGHQEEAEEGDSCQRQPLVHVHKGRVGRGLLHGFGLSSLIRPAAASSAATILTTDL
ncbi:hypothetical protein JZ751_019437 [Albula glossodonta]|uniref:Uncharacterized protein n=1 Tax=Albula glossodonta TaxID=121402 RepID=A0A8T2NKR7_9TELE|nr:hypothetical protein JZ751_019437 [Albula glossodonta]